MVRTAQYLSPCEPVAMEEAADPFSNLRRQRPFPRAGGRQLRSVS